MDSPAALEERVEELERALNELRARLRTLVYVLPPEYLPYVEGLIVFEEQAAADLIFGGLNDGVELTPSDVATELEELWRRINPGSETSCDQSR